MQAVLVIKTANGYAVVPCDTDTWPAIKFANLSVATSIGDPYTSGPTVLNALRDTFEPKDAA